MAVRIIVDSGSDLEKHEWEALNVQVAPMTITFGEDVYEDGYTITKEEFYNKLVKEDLYPTTSQPNPDMFFQMYEEAKEAGDDVVVVTISTALSGTYQSANIAKNMVEYEPIYIVDSLSATLGERLLIDAAVKMRDSGKTGAEIAEALEELKGKIQITAAIDTLKYLQKGGRLSKAEASVGTLANIKPLITVTPDGRVETIDKALGKRRAFNKIVDYFKEAQINYDYPPYFIYSMEEDNCDTMISMIQQAGFDVSCFEKKQLGGTIGAHIGNGAFGFIYIRK